MSKHPPWHPEAFLQNRWTRKYRALVEAAQAEGRVRVTGEHAEHHIVPESFFIQRSRPGQLGWLPGNPEDPSNLVLLTHREHAQCHLWLWERMTAGPAKIKMTLAIQLTLGDLAAKGIPHRVPVALLERIMREAAEASSEVNRGTSNGRYDHAVRDWAHFDGRTFTGTRSELEAWAVLRSGALSDLTRKKPKKTAQGWFIVIPGEAPPLPPRERMRMALRGRPSHNRGKSCPKHRDTTNRDWAHKDGRTFTGTRRELEEWAGLSPGVLRVLTKAKNPSNTAHGWRIVEQAGEPRPKPLASRSGQQKSENGPRGMGPET